MIDWNSEEKREHNMGVSHKHKTLSTQEGSLHLKKWNSNLHRVEVVTVHNCEVNKHLTDARRRYNLRGRASVAAALIFRGWSSSFLHMCLRGLWEPSKAHRSSNHHHLCVPTTGHTSVSWDCLPPGTHNPRVNCTLSSALVLKGLGEILP